MLDKSSLAIPEDLKQYIEAIVEDVLLEGKTFEEQEQYLRHFCESGGIQFEELKDHLFSFFEAARALDLNDSSSIDTLLTKGEACYLPVDCIDNIIQIYTYPASGKRQGTILFRVMKGQRFGFVDNLGNVVVRPRYLDAHAFSEKMAAVKVGNLWGFINLDGKMVINPQFEKVSDFHESLAAVCQNSFWGYINQEGKLVIPCQYIGAGDFSEGQAHVCKKNKKWGYINTLGDRIIELQFNEAFAFNNGLARVRAGAGNLYGFINKKGRFVVDPTLEFARDFSEQMVFVLYSQHDSNYYCYLDEKGHPIFTCGWNYADDFHEGLACVSTAEEFGFINKTGAFAIRAQFDDANAFSDGYAAVKMGKLWGYVDKTGNTAVPPQFLEAGDFQDGYAIVENGNEYCVIDKKGVVTARDIYVDQLTNKKNALDYNKKNTLDKDYIKAGKKYTKEQQVKDRLVLHDTLLCAIAFFASLVEFSTFRSFHGWGWAFVPAFANIFFMAFRLDLIHDLNYTEFKTAREFALSFIPIFLINVLAFIFTNGWSLAVILPVLIISFWINAFIYDD